MTRRWPGRVLALGGLALLANLVTSAIDHRVTASRLPEVGIFTPDRPAHTVPAVAEREQLEDGFVARAWLYSLASIIAVVAVTVAGLRSAPRARWHALFTDLGVAAVCALGLSSVISLIGPMLLDKVSKLPIWLPPVVMLVGAGVGSLLTRREDEALAVGGVPANGPPGPPRGDSGGGSPGSLVARIGRITLGLAVVTGALLAILSAGVAGSGCSGDRTGGGLGVVLLGAMGSGFAVGVCGVVALIARRWVLSLLSISFAVIALVLAVAAAIGPCLS